MKKDIFNWIIFVVVAFGLIALEFYSVRIDSRYKWDAIFLFALLLAVFLLRKKLNINPIHFFLFGLFLISHNLGVFNLYRNFYFGIEYDIYVHTFFWISFFSYFVSSFWDKEK
ncbi:hypothetical protein KAS08_05845 [Candidatus Pacearchaeota archaeon]|nr:hypothetical protein [Candidatus Pacearchaeota archaeon]